jgi:hypothetical protein
LHVALRLEQGQHLARRRHGIGERRLHGIGPGVGDAVRGRGDAGDRDADVAIADAAPQHHVRAQPRLAVDEEIRRHELHAERILVDLQRRRTERQIARRDIGDLQIEIAQAFEQEARA